MCGGGGRSVNKYYVESEEVQRVWRGTVTV